MAVFVSYSDETETGSLSDFLVSGYIADEKLVWPFFAAAWQERVLGGPPKIPFLHMTQIRNLEWRSTEGNGISKLDSEDRITAAVNLLATCGDLSIVTSAIRRADLNSAILSKFGSAQETGEGCCSCGFLKGNEFRAGSSQALCLQ
jgi:hypothetical protein